MRKPQLANRKDCTGCLACVDSCRNNALNYYIGNDGHYYVKIDDDSCIGCFQCEKSCPATSRLLYGKSECAKAYAAWNKNYEVRAESASGGAFSAMAQFVLDQGGVVIGATLDNINDVSHVVISDTNDLPKLQGSKYTQSNTKGIYKQTLKHLKEGETVLFSGTGCQVGGLYSFLRNKIYNGNLITVDLICGGVPSKLLIQKFVENEPYKIRRIVSFRTKENGWKPKGFEYNLKVEDVNGVIHDYSGIHNLVTTGFSVELTERYSCYNCKYVGLHRLSDFTIGDLWGDEMYPNEHYNGLSLLVAHNQKALDLLDSMSNYLQTAPCNNDSAIKVNFRLVDGRNVRRFTVERKFVRFFFNNCSYTTLKAIYANEYNIINIWTPWIFLRRIYVKLLNIIFK